MTSKIYSCVIVFLSIIFSASSQNVYNYNSRYRPCPNLRTVCISEYLACRSSCKIPNSGVVREPFYVPLRQLDLPSINVTMFRYDVEFSNILSGEIEDFFVDRASGYTVLSVLYRNLNIDVGLTQYETNRRADVPLIETTPTDILYPELVITTVFPSSEALNLATARSTGYLPVMPVFAAVFNGEAVSAIHTNFDKTTPEALLTTSPIVNRFFIQSLLCDFGIQANQLGITN